MQSFVGTLLHMTQKYIQVDIYSFSFLMYQLMTGIFSKIQAKNEFWIVKAVTEGKRPDLTIIKDKEVKSFISKCWLSDPSEKPEFSQIVDELKTEKYF